MNEFWTESGTSHSDEWRQRLEAERFLLWCGIHGTEEWAARGACPTGYNRGASEKEKEQEQAKSSRCV